MYAKQCVLSFTDPLSHHLLLRLSELLLLLFWLLGNWSELPLHWTLWSNWSELPDDNNDDDNNNNNDDDDDDDDDDDNNNDDDDDD